MNFTITYLESNDAILMTPNGSLIGSTKIMLDCTNARMQLEPREWQNQLVRYLLQSTYVLITKILIVLNARRQLERERSRKSWTNSFY